jgi:hypothetical protein
MQKLEFYLGQLGGMLNICGYYSLSSDLKELANLSPYGREGIASVMAYDAIRGGYCGKLAADGETLMADRDQLWAYLTRIYDCPGGACLPEGGDPSLTAACRAEADERLMTLPVGTDDIQGVWMINRPTPGTRTPGVAGAESNQPGVRRGGYEAWVKLKSCSGWLVIDLSANCMPRKASTSGECTIEEIKGR